MIQVAVGGEAKPAADPCVVATWWLEPARHVPLSHWVSLEFLPPPNIAPKLLKCLSFIW